MLGGGGVLRWPARATAIAFATLATRRGRSLTFNATSSARHSPTGLAASWTTSGSCSSPNLDYGYDFARMADRLRARQAADGRRRARSTVAADRGWQSSGVRLEAGKRYRTARQRPLSSRQPDRGVWKCEPGGVTIRYYRGRPLGILLAAVATDESKTAGDRRPARAHRDRPGIARSHPSTAARSTCASTIRPAALADNAGSLTVEITDAA